MIKLGFLFALVAFFGFATLTSCNQPAEEEEHTEGEADEKDHDKGDHAEGEHES